MEHRERKEPAATAAYVDVYASAWAWVPEQPTRRMVVEVRALAVPPGLAGHLVAVGEVIEALRRDPELLAAVQEARVPGQRSFTVEVTNSSQARPVGVDELDLDAWHELLFYADFGPVLRGGPIIA